MNDYAKVYRHSGKIGPAALSVPIMGIIGAIILSFVYAYITVYSPIAGYISILFVLGFAFGVGFVISKAGYWGKCRNLGFLYFLGFLISIFALYSSWVVFIYALVNKSAGTEVKLSIISMFSSPSAIWEFIKAINETGWYSIRSWTPSGTVLWIFWGIEALIIVIITTVMSSSSIDSEIFCENCSKWCSSLESFHLALPEDAALLEELKNGEADKVAQLDRVPESEYPHVSVELLCCNTCKDTAGYKLKLATKEVDKDGKGKETSEDLSDLFVLPYSSFEKLRNLSDRPIKES